MYRLAVNQKLHEAFLRRLPHAHGLLLRGLLTLLGLVPARGDTADRENILTTAYCGHSVPEKSGIFLNRLLTLRRCVSEYRKGVSELMYKRGNRTHVTKG